MSAVEGAVARLHRQIGARAACAARRLRSSEPVSTAAMLQTFRERNKAQAAGKSISGNSQLRQIELLDFKGMWSFVCSADFTSEYFERRPVHFRLPRSAVHGLPEASMLLEVKGPESPWMSQGPNPPSVRKAAMSRLANGRTTSKESLRTLCFVKQSFSDQRNITSSPVPVGQRVGASELRQILDSGWTAIAHAAQLWDRSTAQLCLDASYATSRTCSANLYITAAGLETAMEVHNDHHCTFIVQTQGEKRWNLWLPPDAMLPVNNRRIFGKAENRSICRSDLGSPCFSLTLQPGHVLYVPRGALHATDTLDTTMRTDDLASHLTIGLDTWPVPEDFSSGLTLPGLSIHHIVKQLLTPKGAKHCATVRIDRMPQKYLISLTLRRE